MIDSPLPQSKVRELTSGIDALYLSGNGSTPTRLLDHLEAEKEEARDNSARIPFILGGEEFGLSPHGWGKYAFSLDHANGRIGFTRSEKLPRVRVQPRAHFLHGAGVEPAVEWFSETVGEQVADLQWRVSRIDLFVDVQGWVPTVADRGRFVTRSRSLDMHERNNSFTGYTFGSRRGGGISGRAYDKTADVARTGALYWFDLWGDRYQEREPVFRVEFEFGRTVLNQFGIKSPADAFASVGDLWAYGTEWLSLRDSTSDETKSRWPVSAEWQAIANATLRSRRIGAARAKQRLQQGSIRKMMPGLCGSMAKFGWLADTVDLPSTLSRFEREALRYGSRTATSFETRLMARHREMPWTD